MTFVPGWSPAVKQFFFTKCGVSNLVNAVSFCSCAYSNNLKRALYPR